MSVKAMEKVAKIVGKGVKFCEDCMKKDCKFRGIVFDCDEKVPFREQCSTCCYWDDLQPVAPNGFCNYAEVDTKANYYCHRYRKAKIVVPKNNGDGKE